MKNILILMAMIMITVGISSEKETSLDGKRKPASIKSLETLSRKPISKSNVYLRRYVEAYFLGVNPLIKNSKQRTILSRIKQNKWSIDFTISDNGVFSSCFKIGEVPYQAHYETKILINKKIWKEIPYSQRLELLKQEVNSCL